SSFSYVFTGGSARSWFSLDPARAFFSDPQNAVLTIALGVALLLYVGIRRCRYFGNTAPLLMTLVLFPLVTTQTVARPWLWALPFLFTFLSGVFADILETRYRKLFLALTGLLLITQAALCLAGLNALALHL
ncbi:MAG TPA: hypothetical protein VGB69_02590, partial [Edaphobacter sp.]